MSSKPNIDNVTSIQKLMSVDRYTVLEKCKSGGYVKYDDGVDVYMSNSEIILTRFLLEVINVLPKELNIPIPSKFNVIDYYTNDIYTSDTMNTF